MPAHIQITIRVTTLAICLVLAACTGKTPGTFSKNIDAGHIRDLQTLPQDLYPYAQKAGADTPLLAAEDQAMHTAKSLERIFRPWAMAEPSRGLRTALGKDFNMRQGAGYGADLQPFSDEQWASLQANANKGRFPAQTGRAITVRNTHMRAMPTATPYYLDPSKAGEGPPFDYFQHSALWVGNPVFVAHASADGDWLLVETPFAAGWVPAVDLAWVDAAFIQHWRSLPMLAPVQDKIPLGKGLAHIGTLLPQAGDALAVFYPERGPNGQATTSRATLPEGAALPLPVPLTAQNIAKVGNAMMGQPYGWGGLNENRDCSSLTRDLFTPFGIWLPRNSASQGGWGSPLTLVGLEPAAKEALIREQAIPFFSLVWLRGHIGLYLGQQEGKPVMFHNIWGLQTRDPGTGEEGRAVIGKAVVTTLRPGAELPGLANPDSLLARVERISLLPESSEKSPVIRPVAKKVSPKKRGQRR